ncbi:type B 50S ribosomal protein L31 [Streptomyces sp. ST2-7A]|uniref:type B 50S ribosomal protein L31 n=1 Tax=Streptomyces sp. ST2-7A TaxID=2907214 RepID=UPI001F28850E|nr:type B 50S ribosomal protein L31 [Streptomyces sp. ST2-7A]MCE7083320.1 type B 50S ribosomal protein L31 [Streptomyces sp. ST2-7A]
MKSGIHPTYGPVVFRDRAADHAFLTRSTLAGTANGGKTIEWEDGNTYPVIDVETSSVSHPFYTGTARVLDTAGRVERFERRYGSARTGRARAGGSSADASGARDGADGGR